MSTAIGVRLARVAERVMLGEPLARWTELDARIPTGVAVRTPRAAGLDADFPKAYLKALLTGGDDVPAHGRAFIAARLAHAGFGIVTPDGMARSFTRQGLAVEIAPDPYDVALVVDTREGRAAPGGVPCCTSLDGADTFVAAIEALRGGRGCRRES